MFDRLQNADSLRLQGRLDEAAHAYQQILRAEPRNFVALYNLSMIAFQTGQLERAEQLLVSTLTVNPGFAEGWCARGIVLLQLHRHPEAIASFDRALALRPDFIDAICSRGTALLESDRHDEALAEFDRAIAVAPDHALSWNNRGNTFVAMRRHEEALACFEKALAINPDMPVTVNNRDFALLELKRLRKVPAEAMRALFDDIASHYDETMLEKLGYRGHVHVRTMAERVLPHMSPPWRILDLGCGTGLVGDLFKDLAVGGRLDGIDIAPRMIEAARARGIYDDLILGDLETVLAEPGPSYNLILSADTMIYIGDLEPTFSGVYKRLVPGGYYVFACERKDDGTWEQNAANRYQHSEAYLRMESERAGLTFVDIMDCVLRTESNVPVPGWAVALRKPPEGNAE